jgi:hypothetical protein
MNDEVKAIRSYFIVHRSDFIVSSLRPLCALCVSAVNA